MAQLARAVTSDDRGLRFESSQRPNFTMIFTVKCWKDEDSRVRRVTEMSERHLPENTHLLRKGKYH